VSPEVQLDQDVFDFLKANAEPFSDTPSSVLRRLLNLASNPSKVTVKPEVPDVSRPRVRPRQSAKSKDGKKFAAKEKEKRPRAAAGTLLPESTYELPLLGALVDLGGEGAYREVAARVGQELKDQFLPADLEHLHSGGIRWQSRLQFVRLRAIERGYLEKDSPRGVWKITGAGRATLAKRAADVDGN
jgi:hypothetical protein